MSGKRFVPRKPPRERPTKSGLSEQAKAIFERTRKALEQTGGRPWVK